MLVGCVEVSPVAVDCVIVKNVVVDAAAEEKFAENLRTFFSLF